MADSVRGSGFLNLPGALRGLGGAIWDPGQVQYSSCHPGSLWGQLVLSFACFENGFCLSDMSLHHLTGWSVEDDVAVSADPTRSLGGPFVAPGQFEFLWWVWF